MSCSTSSGSVPVASPGLNSSRSGFMRIRKSLDETFARRRVCSRCSQKSDCSSTEVSRLSLSFLFVLARTTRTVRVFVGRMRGAELFFFLPLTAMHMDSDVSIQLNAALGNLAAPLRGPSQASFPYSTSHNCLFAPDGLEVKGLFVGARDTVGKG